MESVPAVPGNKAKDGNVKFFAEGYIGDPSTTIIREATNPTTGRKTEESEVINFTNIPAIRKKIDAILKHRTSRSPLKGPRPRGVDAQDDSKLLGASDDELRALSEKLADVRRGHEWHQKNTPDWMKRLAEE